MAAIMKVSSKVSTEKHYFTRKVSSKVSAKKHYFTRMVSAMVSPKSAMLNIQPERENWLSRMVNTAMVRGKVRTETQGAQRTVRNTVRTKCSLFPNSFGTKVNGKT